jgi:Holliday junction resolvase-like predicted endonuclease
MQGEEAKLQAKILLWLKNNDYWVFKTIICNRNGIMDIIACSPKGRFVGIEVKSKNGTLTKLQSYNISEVVRRGGVSFEARSLETVIKTLSSL